MYNQYTLDLEARKSKNRTKGEKKGAGMHADGVITFAGAPSFDRRDFLTSIITAQIVSGPNWNAEV